MSPFSSISPVSPVSAVFAVPSHGKPIFLRVLSENAAETGETGETAHFPYWLRVEIERREVEQ